MGAGAGSGRGQLFLRSLLFLLLAGPSAGGQLRYAVPEELEHGAFVANLGEDLGLDVSTLSARRFRIVSRAGARQHLEVNLENGILFVNERIDREEVCEAGGTCLLHLQLLVESPLELYRVEVEVLDINDHAPTFPWQEYVLEVAESAALGARFPLESAQDPDVGTNSVHTYRLSPNGFFSLEVQTRSDASKFAELVLERALDREQQRVHRMLLTALDGGVPERSGTAHILVTVLDANDNVPAFDQPSYGPSYSVYVMENNAPGASICSVSALDPDCQQNAYLSYSIADGHIHGMPVGTYVSINSDSGHMYALRSLDYEQIRSFQIQVQAQDAGFPPLSANVTVHIFVLDQNDNAPVIVSPMPRNGSVATELVPRSARPGYLVGTVSAVDADAGLNSRLSYQLLQATDFTLFSVAPDTGELRTLRSFLEQDATRQRLVVQVRDGGQPALSATVSLLLSVVETMPQTLSDFSEFSLPPEASSSSPLTLYLLVSLGSISFTFLLAILILTAIRCRGEHRSRQGDGCSPPRCHCCPGSRPSPDGLKTSNLTVQPPTGTTTTTCLDVPGSGPPGYCYKVCLGPESAQSDFMFLKPCSPPRNNEKDTGKRSWPGQHLQVSKQIKQPNTDWLPPSTQRPALKRYQMQHCGNRERVEGGCGDGEVTSEHRTF
ncbi:PCDG2 protein, partial [Corythaeola cristata]|nr:PCDG2 protein [Corythaeola cristata]